MMSYLGRLQMVIATTKIIERNVDLMVEVCLNVDESIRVDTNIPVFDLAVSHTRVHL